VDLLLQKVSKNIHTLRKVLNWTNEGRKIFPEMRNSTYFWRSYNLGYLKKMKTKCDEEGEISNWTNWHNFGPKIVSIWYIFQIQLVSTKNKDKNQSKIIKILNGEKHMQLRPFFFKIYDAWLLWRPQRLVSMKKWYQFIDFDRDTFCSYCKE
jgi:hypothetical protein